MKLKRQIILYLCIILLALLSMTSLVLRFSAPNPTHRWYSSDYVDMSLPNYVFGLEAEQILSNDLSLPRNDSSEGERICFCSTTYTAPTGRCNICLVETASISTWAIPDFITDEAIIDSKAVSNFRTDEQIETFLLVAEATQRELWIFVRLDTLISEMTLSRIQATGGDIIPYFVVDGYENRLMFEAFVNGLLVFVVVITVGLVIWAYILKNRPQNPGDTVDSREEIHKAEDSVQETEEFMKRMERLSKRSKDEDDKKGKL